jgi:hypothetical protein
MHAIVSLSIAQSFKGMEPRKGLWELSGEKGREREEMALRGAEEGQCCTMMAFDAGKGMQILVEGAGSTYGVYFRLHRTAEFF